jgi:N-methylhydantoinase A
MRYRLGVDVGGTHTDLVLLDTTSGALLVEKVASTPKNPALGVLVGVTRLLTRGIAPDAIGFFAHGTTITTNALLEMRGAKVGLLITKGYRAVQEVQTQARDGNLFDYFYAKPAPIAPQSLTREISERLDCAGNVLRPLDEAAVRAAVHELRAAGVQSIAVCYLFSFMNPAHEQRTRDLILEEYPGVHISMSSDVLPRIREWPRLSTTLLNAYLEPVMVYYIGHLNAGLDTAGVRTRQRFLMQSNGGVMPFSAALAGGRTVHTLFSGPAAGAQASAHLARHDPGCGLVTLDMGGTSADIAFIEGGAPLEATEGVIARRQIDVPALDMSTISAGGGSIAWVDGGGFLNVGPHSAGADPGPVCYRRGGTQPTVTDADLICGLLNPDYFLGGEQSLDIAAAREALQIQIAEPLGMDLLTAAMGIQRIVDMRMADEVRVFGVKRGVDITSFTLLPFGGAGAVHAAAVAEELGIRRILVPPQPGAFSALGLLCTDVVHDYIRSELRPLADVTAIHAEQVFHDLETRGRAELAAEGLNSTDAIFARELDLRYSGQGYELRTPLAGLFVDRLTAESLAAARDRFDQRHAHIHGHAAKERPVEIVSYRLRLRVAVPKYQPVEACAAVGAPLDSLPLAEERRGAASAAVKGERTVALGGMTMHAMLYERDRLDAGATIEGPAIVEQFDATTLIPPAWRATVDGFRNLVLRRDA